MTHFSSPWRVAGLRALSVVGALVLAFSSLASVSLVFAHPLSTSDTEIEDALDYLRGEQDSDGSIIDYGTTCWVVCAVVAADEDPADWDNGGDSLIEYLEAEVDSLSSAFEYALAILAVVAAEEDPTSFGGADLVSLLEDEYVTGQLGDRTYLNDDFWGLMALVAAGDDADSTIISNVRDFIISNQSSDSEDYGSWGWGLGETGDVDDTAAAIMALMATGTSTSSSVITDGLDYIADNQDDMSGGFLSWGSTNPDTDSWAICALVAAGEDLDSSEWEIGEDLDPVDDLLSFQRPDGGFFVEGGSEAYVPTTTASAIQALLGVPWPVAIASSSSDDAELAVAPAEFTSAATEDGEDPVEQTLVIWNEGDDTLEWDVESDEDWLDLSPSSGSSTGEEDEVTLSFDISGLDADTYEATITITANGADGSPETVDVELVITEAATEPEIAFNPSSLEFTAEEGGDDPLDQVLEVWNADAAPDAIDWEVEWECDEDWIDLSPEDGSTDGEHVAITVSVDIDGLDADTYEATITLTSPDADNSPETIDVTLEITGDGSGGDEEAVIDYSPSDLEFEAIEDGDDPDDETLKIWNDREGDMDWEVESDEDWLSLSPDDGTSSGEKDSVDVSVDIDDLAAGEYEATITITSSDADNSPERLDVTLTIEEEEEEDTTKYHQLYVMTNPSVGGSITRSLAAEAKGYPEDTTVTLTAVPVGGHAFTGWTGDAAGITNPITLEMTSDHNVTASFLRFDAAGLNNIVLTYASPGMAAVTIIPYPVANIPSSPEGFRLLSAYVVEPAGTGSFSLRFDGVADAANVAVFKVVGGLWAQVPRSVVGDSSIQITLPADDPVLALAYPGSSGSDFGQTIKDLFGGADSTVIIIVAAAVIVVILVVLLLFFFGPRRDEY